MQLLSAKTFSKRLKDTSYILQKHRQKRKSANTPNAKENKSTMSRSQKGVNLFITPASDCVDFAAFPQNYFDKYQANTFPKRRSKIHRSARQIHQMTNPPKQIYDAPDLSACSADFARLRQIFSDEIGAYIFANFSFFFFVCCL